MDLKYSMVAATQLSSLPGCSIIQSEYDGGGQLTATGTDTAGRIIFQAPVTGFRGHYYRVRCDKLPRKSSLMLAVAVANLEGEGPLRYLPYSFKRIPDHLILRGHYRAALRERALEIHLNATHLEQPRGTSQLMHPVQLGRQFSAAVGF
jgi:hypothetical protein